MKSRSGRGGIRIRGLCPPLPSILQLTAWLSESLTLPSVPIGPSNWHKLYPIAQGDRQSPINIVSSQAVYSPSLQPLELFYEACMSLSITNNGHSVQVDFNDSDDRTGKWPQPKSGTNPFCVLTMGEAILGGAACCGREVKLYFSPNCGEAQSSVSVSHCIKWSDSIL